MSEYVIEKDVPVPEVRRGAQRKYPFPDMEVGDSICVGERRAAYAAHEWGRKHGKKFAQRKNGDGLRIWRIA